MSPTLPASLITDVRRLGRCARCPRDREPDSDHCAGCDAKLKGYVRKSKAARRARRRLNHECIDCGNKLPKRWNGTRCRKCRQEQRTDARSRRVKRAQRRVKRAQVDLAPARGHYKTEVFADGAERTRYVGQSHRGGPTRQEQDASADKLVGHVQSGTQAWRDERIEKQAAVDALPRIQRAAGRKQIGAQLTYLGRLLIQAAAEYGDDVARDLLRALYPEEEA